MKIQFIQILSDDGKTIDMWDDLDTETMIATRWDCGRVSEEILVHDLNVLPFNDEGDEWQETYMGFPIKFKY